MFRGGRDVLFVLLTVSSGLDLGYYFRIDRILGKNLSPIHLFHLKKHSNLPSHPEYDGRKDADRTPRAGSPSPTEVQQQEVEHRERRHYSPRDRNFSNLGTGNLSPREPHPDDIARIPPGYRHAVKNDYEVGQGHGKRRVDEKFGPPGGFMKGMNSGRNEEGPLKRFDVSVSGSGDVSTRLTVPEKKIRGVTGGANTGRQGLHKNGEELSPARPGGFW